MPNDKQVPLRGRAREVSEEESRYSRDTIPPSPDKARIIESAINKEVIVRLDAVGEDPDPEDPDEALTPPASGDLDLEQIQEGVQYRIVEPASKLPSSTEATRGTDADGTTDGEDEVSDRRKKLEALEVELREKEERLLQREVVVGGREKILRKKEERLHQREVSLRNWEARLMDKEASLRDMERADVDGGVMAERDTMEPPEEPRLSRPSELRIEIPGGSGMWEMVEELEDDSGDGI